MKELPTDIVSRTTIEFSPGIETKKLETLFDFIANGLPQGEVRYTKTIQMVVGNRLGKGFENAKRNIQLIDMRGFISSGMTCVPFEIYRDSKKGYNPQRFDGLRFITTPGYEIYDLGKEDVELMDKTRTLVETAFS